jgi:hypothetical protein
MMKKWALSAIVYLLVIVGAYYAFDSFTGTESEEVDHAAGDNQHNIDTEHTENNEEEGHEEESHEEAGHDEEHGEEHSEHGASEGISEVLAMLHEESGNLVITLKDIKGNPVSDIEVNHEKLMHLIVVSTDLQDYYHLHPETDEPGVFKVPHSLEDGEYKIFVDIKPKNLAYEVQPIEFVLGNAHGDHEHGALKPDHNFVKQTGNHTATLQPTSLNVNEEIQLQFDLNGETPEQHLGALGHVVILDEKANQYIHVHPQHGDQPIFETKFTQPGVYKIWAEFKFNGEVFVFPYVVEIK